MKTVKKTAAAALSVSVLFAGSAMTGHAGDKSAEEVLNHANDAMADLESYSALIETHQTISDDVMGETEAHTTTEQDVIMNPFKLREVMTVSAEGEEFTVTTYWTEEGLYIGDETGEWIKIEDDGLYEVMFDPDHQLGGVNGYGEDLSLSEEDGYYVITYDGDGEELMHLFEMGGTGQEGEGDFMAELGGDMEISHFWYELQIDSDTHYLTGIEMEMDITFNFEDESQTIEQLIEVTYHNFNSVEDFDVPADVREQAEDLEEAIEEEMEEDGDELPATATNTPMMALAGLLTAAGAAAILAVRRRLINT
ncbi:DUF6612 family protein [Alteribacter natronophilus]|uniref:DUF6612 family protein n=1 Tax=Alteribacter natronophilus TaxID=2583810 RepID=UPI00110EB496|nr:DUF6612 family protein [Alteribacter natronophilus]TMW73445.1 LPXTG cell wall anchor domain-containing protein [Alteribacter natronophilus]